MSTYKKTNNSIFKYLEVYLCEKIPLEKLEKQQKCFSNKGTISDWAKENHLSIGSEIPYYLASKVLYWDNPDYYTEIVLFQHYGKWYSCQIDI